MVVKARDRKRYELRTYAPAPHGGWHRVGLTLRGDDSYGMALEVWRLVRSLPVHWRVEVRDLSYGRLAPLVSYEQLMARHAAELRSVLDSATGVAS